MAQILLTRTGDGCHQIDRTESTCPDRQQTVEPESVTRMESDSKPVPSAASERVTRGHGLLEGWLSKQRTHRANRLIPNHLRDGRILDIGCGSHPYFLTHTTFREKYSLDQVDMPAETAAQHGIKHHAHDLDRDPRLPFDDGTFHAITLLAVIEHVEPEVAVRILREAHRALAPGGRLIVTTPAAWTDGLLHLLAKLKMVSSEEIHEHAFAYTLPTLACCLGQAGFDLNKLQCGYFELRMNLWAVGGK
jgi:2-polyprenyl-3-methyl-5-hydroxy-6-metoxy-1,4-benzoquinol methylase